MQADEIILRGKSTKNSRIAILLSRNLNHMINQTTLNIVNGPVAQPGKPAMVWALEHPPFKRVVAGSNQRENPVRPVMRATSWQHLT